MLDKIEKKIQNLKGGEKLILGYGVQAIELQKVIALCENLESEGQIKIIQKPQSLVIGKKSAESLLIQKA